MGPTSRANEPAAAARAPTEVVLLNDDGRVIGRLRFRACPTCRTGRILDIWVCDDWQRQGLGRELVHSLLAPRPGYRWSTTLQSRDGRALFLAMTHETSVALDHDGPLCCHLMGSLRRWWQRVLNHWSPGWTRSRDESVRAASPAGEGDLRVCVSAGLRRLAVVSASRLGRRGGRSPPPRRDGGGLERGAACHGCSG
ncbi:GNAT family N-acetyltransferase [Streptomyces luteolifulvus]|uniref:GNAT family N-acetyltransferase n=1 Tax=Streptomyces luteolifulvus TaxID=2615112 RepID=UPI00177D3BCA